jgi:hypothetical protein
MWAKAKKIMSQDTFWANLPPKLVAFIKNFEVNTQTYSVYKPKPAKRVIEVPDETTIPPESKQTRSNKHKTSIMQTRSEGPQWSERFKTYKMQTSAKISTISALDAEISFACPKLPDSVVSAFRASVARSLVLVPHVHRSQQDLLSHRRAVRVRAAVAEEQHFAVGDAKWKQKMERPKKQKVTNSLTKEQTWLRLISVAAILQLAAKVKNELNAKKLIKITYTHEPEQDLMTKNKEILKHNLGIEGAEQVALSVTKVHVKIQVIMRRYAASKVWKLLQSWRTCGQALLAMKRFSKTVDRIKKLWKNWKYWKERVLEADINKRWVSMEKKYLYTKMTHQQSHNRHGPGLSLADKVEVAMTPELERVVFVREELRVRRFELVPAMDQYNNAVKNFLDAQTQWSLELRACMLTGSKMLMATPEKPATPSQIPTDEELMEWIRRCRVDPSSFRVITTFVTQQHKFK